VALKGMADCTGAIKAQAAGLRTARHALHGRRQPHHHIHTTKGRRPLRFPR
jgi:hypothetical protein